MQVETNDSGIVFEWIPYNQFYEIEETGKNGFMTVYSAILWKDGPLYKKYRWSTNYTKDSNKEVDLRCLHTNSQTPIESLINEVYIIFMHNACSLMFICCNLFISFIAVLG
jgi:hypothetical protein